MPPRREHFTLDEIETGIRKFKRRIDEVKALDPTKIHYKAPQVEAATRNIRADLRDVFGEGSPEYNAHFRKSVSYPDGARPSDSDRDSQHRFIAGLPNIVLMLEGLVKRLGEKREDLGSDTTARVRSSFEGLDLHPRIGEASADLYRNGHYRNAVLDASLALEDYVKQKSRCRDRDGADLMRFVFSKNNTVLAFNDLADETDRGEQEGFMHLFEGVMLALRNPRAHALSDDSPEEALEYIAMLSLLAKRLEKSRRTAP